MDSAPGNRTSTAYIAPMATFLAFLALNSALKAADGAFWLRSAEYWIYPVQTISCGALVLFYKREYEFAAPRRVWVAIVVAVLIFAIWIAPQVFFGVPPRTSGYNPELFNTPSAYWTNIALRFLRLVVVVPFVEEIFWRGFLLRYLISNNFTRVPFGAFSWLSFAVVSLAFMFTHASADWPAALVCGALYNCVAYLTKSLASCVIAHATTNLLLGLWIMHSHEWGFW